MMPRKAAAEPARPRKRAPTAIERLTMLGPGRNWQSANVSRNSRSDSQCVSSTSLRRAQGSTPPKATAETIMKLKNSSRSVGISAAPPSSLGTGSAITRRSTLAGHSVGAGIGRPLVLLVTLGERLVEALVAAIDVVTEFDRAVGIHPGRAIEQIDRNGVRQLHAPGLAGGNGSVDRIHRPGGIAGQNQPRQLTRIVDADTAVAERAARTVEQARRGRVMQIDVERVRHLELYPAERIVGARELDELLAACHVDIGVAIALEEVRILLQCRTDLVHDDRIRHVPGWIEQHRGHRHPHDRARMIDLADDAVHRERRLIVLEQHHTGAGYVDLDANRRIVARHGAPTLEIEPDFAQALARRDVERWRSMPRDNPAIRVEVNIPGASVVLFQDLSLIHISEPTRQAEISYAV